MQRTTAAMLATALVLSAAETRGAETVEVWPSAPPGETKQLPPESDIYKPTDDKIAGRKIIKLANVSTPTIEVRRPASDRDTGASVVICPGGGHSILAYDLEGTEVAEWLNSIGVTGIILKYRVPAREPQQRWRAAVQDAQRAVSLVRSRAEPWMLDPNRIGILGFSAGGETAGLAALFGKERKYEPVDQVDETSCRPDFAILIYPAGMVDDENQLRDYVNVQPTTPPMFLAHAYDDGVSPMNSLALFAELKRAGVPAELHIYSAGGHGYGLRPTELPVTSWPARCHEWLQQSKLLRRGE